MVHPYAVAGFLVAVLPLIATPGASLALLIQHVTDSGRRQAFPVTLGTVTGLYIHATPRAGAFPWGEMSASPGGQCADGGAM